MMFGTANAARSTPRPGSKRSTALIRPIDPTWTRSSTRFAAMHEAPCERARERQVGLDQPLARLEVAVGMVRTLQLRNLRA